MAVLLLVFVVVEQYAHHLIARPRAPSGAKVPRPMSHSPHGS
ncbi:hypothetical protein [Phycicoccus sp. Soil802]|nr:hypothetical protein [Phycicoccus sp. Soil802]